MFKFPVNCGFNDMHVCMFTVFKYEILTVENQPFVQHWQDAWGDI